MKARRVFLHIGSPKTGTTYLQTLLWDHREMLREQHDLLIPGQRYDDHFFAAVDLQDRTFHGSPRPDSAGAWKRIVDEVHGWSGTVVISHEVLAGASIEQAQRAIADLAPAEVHIIHTVRDLGRQLPSRWQEDVKHGAVDTFDAWWAAACKRDGSHHFARWFWPTEDPVDIVARWGSTVDPQHYHVVSVPRSGSSGGLWARFCSVIGLDPSAIDVAGARISNNSLGIAEVELVRQINERLEGSLSPVVHHHLIKGVLAHDTLARHSGGRRLTLPPEYLPQVDELAKNWLAALRESGVDLVIDDEDLIPRAASEPADIGPPTEQELAETAVWTVREVLLRLETERREHAAVREALEARCQQLDHEVESLRATLVRPGLLRRARRRITGGRNPHGAGPLGRR